MRIIILAILNLSLVGCTTFRQDTRTPTGGQNTFAENLRAISHDVLGTSSKETPPASNWAALMPAGGKRSELVPVVATKAQLLGADSQKEIMLASHTKSPGVEWSINKRKIATYADLRLAQCAATAATEPMFAIIHDANGKEEKIPISPSALARVEESLIVESELVRSIEHDSTWITTKAGGVMVRSTARIDPTRHIAQVYLSLKNCGASVDVMPQNVALRQGDREFSCLSASEVLESLYGSGRRSKGAMENFAVVSEREDYLALPNYTRLAAQLEEIRRRSAVTSEPFLASVKGVPYPGPSILADARALQAFLLQKQRIGQNEAERTGWLFFDISTSHADKPLQLIVTPVQTPIAFEFKQLTG